MFKSKERTTEYAVIMRPYYRENPPICMIGYAKDEDDVANGINHLIGSHYKECLDIKKASEIIWNKETVIKYWEQYGESEIIKERYREEDLETQLF